MTNRIMDLWMRELIMCGYSYPIPRLQAYHELLKCGYSKQAAVEALTWYNEYE